VAKLNNTLLLCPCFSFLTSDPCPTEPSPTEFNYYIRKVSSDVEQIRLDFAHFEIDQPNLGICENATITFSGLDTVTNKMLSSNLCGALTGQHLYLSVKDSPGDIKVSINLGSYNMTSYNATSNNTGSWIIQASQYTGAQTDLLAPRGCLQYHREPIGTIESFNYREGGAGELLTDHRYSVCIKEDPAYCDVALTVKDFDLGGNYGDCGHADNKFVAGPDVYCGDLPTGNEYTWPYTGPYEMSVFTNEFNNTAMNAGFSMDYRLLPC